MLSPRENLLNMYNHRPTEYVPSTFLDQKGFGVFDPLEKGDPAKGGYDAFGVRWVTPRSAGGAPIPAPNEYVLTDITKWREQVTFPDVDSVDWEERARVETAPFSREEKVFDYSNGNGVFMRFKLRFSVENGLNKRCGKSIPCTDSVSYFNLWCFNQSAIMWRINDAIFISDGIDKILQIIFFQKVITDFFIRSFKREQLS